MIIQTSAKILTLMLSADSQLLSLNAPVTSLPASSISRIETPPVTPQNDRTTLDFQK